jgi:hypothetical protein
MRATALPPVSRAQPWFKSLSWGLRPRLYAVARFAGFGFTPPESIRQRASGSRLRNSSVSGLRVHASGIHPSAGFGFTPAGFACLVGTPNPRSRWQNKAWGASPRIVY